MGYKCSAAPIVHNSNKKEHPGLARARGSGHGTGNTGGGGGSSPNVPASRTSSPASDTNLSNNPSSSSSSSSSIKSTKSTKPTRSGSLSPLGQGECPHVVSFYDAYKTSSSDHTISIVLEYMDAGSLQDLIN